jgi:N-acetylglucosaminyl-diphospho-decaprenol L-rhamnosyltransferase
MARATRGPASSASSSSPTRAAPTLERCLEGLRAQTFTDFEVLLVDNASTDGAPQAAAAVDPTIRLLEPGANLGFAAGNNLAARARRGDGGWPCSIPTPTPDPAGWRRWSPRRRAIPRCAASPPCRWWPTEPDLMDGAGDVMTSAGIPFRGGYRRRLPARPGRGRGVLGLRGGDPDRPRAVPAPGRLRRAVLLLLRGRRPGLPPAAGGEPTLLVPRRRWSSTWARPAPACGRTSPIFHGSRNRIWTF